MLHQTQSLCNQRLEVNRWQAERQACIPRCFYFITQETVNKMYESYRRIILKWDKKKRKKCVNTEENKKLGVPSFTSFYLFRLKPLRGIYPDCMVSSFIKGLHTSQSFRRSSGRVPAEGTRTNINIYVNINDMGVYLQIQFKISNHFWTCTRKQDRPLAQWLSAVRVKCFHCAPL